MKQNPYTLLTVFMLYYVKDRETMCLTLANISEEDSYTEFHNRGLSGWLFTEEIVCKKIRMVSYKSTSGHIIYEVQKKFLWYWKTITFEGLDWFSDKEVAIICYMRAVKRTDGKLNTIKHQ